MKKEFITILLMTFAFTLNAQKNTLKLENEVGIDRPDELIILDRSSIEKRFAQKVGARFLQVKDGSNPVVVQHDDLDGDGSWDEAAFLMSFRASEKKNVEVSLAARPATIKAVVRAHVRLRKKDANDFYGNDLEMETMPTKHQANDFAKNPIPYYKTEGPAWENDKVAFRSYFDVRNAKDIFGKTTTSMVMDTVGTYGDKYYHHMGDWGMDILKVGKSLGAGALAIRMTSPQGRDTLVRVTGEHAKRTVYRKIVDGPVRAVFSITYEGWDPLSTGLDAKLTETISIWGGQYFYENHVTYSGIEPKEIVTGIVSLKSETYNTIGQKKNIAIYSYGKQSENNDNLGMAIITMDEQPKKVPAMLNSDVVSTHFIWIKPKKDNSVLYRFYAGWEKSDSRFGTAASFAAFLNEQVQFNQSKIEVDW